VESPFDEDEQLGLSVLVVVLWELLRRVLVLLRRVLTLLLRLRFQCRGIGKLARRLLVGSLGVRRWCLPFWWKWGGSGGSESGVQAAKAWIK
jgi:hypothetical protein